MFSPDCLLYISPPPSLSLSFFHSMFCPDCLLYISPTFVVPLILSFHVLSRLLTLYFSHLRCPSDSFIPCSVQIAYSIFIHLNFLTCYTCTIANTLIFQRKVLNRASLIPASHRRRGATTFFGENRSDTASSFS